MSPKGSIKCSDSDTEGKERERQRERGTSKSYQILEVKNGSEKRRHGRFSWLPSPPLPPSLTVYLISQSPVGGSGTQGAREHPPGKRTTPQRTQAYIRTIKTFTIQSRPPRLSLRVSDDLREARPLESFTLVVHATLTKSRALLLLFFLPIHAFLR